MERGPAVFAIVFVLLPIALLLAAALSPGGGVALLLGGVALLVLGFTLGIAFVDV